jgi:pimeloyl-ACP methyl ester carboxylesterase
MAWVVRDGVRLFVADVGTGPAVVWHTGGGGDHRMWGEAGYLAELPGHRHVLIDHRGHGRSDGPRDLDSHRLDDYVADVYAVLDQLDVGPAAFVGYSAGATVGYAATAAEPTRWTGLVAIGSVPEPVDVDVESLALAARVRELGMRTLMAEFAAAEEPTAPSWFVDNLGGTDPEMFALLLEAWATAPEQPWDDLLAIQVPTLLVTGTEECPDGSVRAAVQRLPAGRAERMVGLGHLQVFWRSDLVAPLVAEFVTTHHPADRTGG